MDKKDLALRFGELMVTICEMQSAINGLVEENKMLRSQIPAEKPASPVRPKRATK